MHDNGLTGRSWTEPSGLESIEPNDIQSLMKFLTERMQLNLSDWSLKERFHQPSRFTDTIAVRYRQLVLGVPVYGSKVNSCLLRCLITCLP